MRQTPSSMFKNTKSFFLSFILHNSYLIYIAYYFSTLQASFRIFFEIGSSAELTRKNFDIFEATMTHNIIKKLLWRC